MPDVPGALEQTFELQTNDPHHSIITLTIRATVKPLPEFIKRVENADVARGEQVGAFNFWPTAHPAVTTEPGERLKIALRIRPIRLDAGDLQLSPGDSKYKLIREQNEDSYWLEINIGPMSEPGLLTFPLVLKAGGSNDLTINLKVTTLAETFVITPKIIDFGAVVAVDLKSGFQKSASLGIRKLIGSFNIKSVSTTLPFLTPQARAMVEGSNYLIKIMVDPGNAPTVGSFDGSLLIQTDDSRRPRFEVPVKITFVER